MVQKPHGSTDTKRYRKIIVNIERERFHSRSNACGGGANDVFYELIFNLRCNEDNSDCAQEKCETSFKRFSQKPALAKTSSDQCSGHIGDDEYGKARYGNQFGKNKNANRGRNKNICCPVEAFLFAAAFMMAE